jgi:hypothetical protein
LNAWPRIIMFRRSRDGKPCLKGQLDDLKHVGKTTFWNWVYSKTKIKLVRPC